MPNGEIIQFDEPYKAPEIMFDTSLVGLESGSVQDLIHNSISHKDLVLTGGSTMFPGFEERLIHELSELGHDINDFKFRGMAQTRCFNSWLGASILSNLNTSKNLMVSKEMFNEEGERVLNNSVY